MKQRYLTIAILFSISVSLFFACSDKDDSEYVPVSPVTVDLTLVPYQKLSEYKFFEGDLKDQIPADGVLPYAPASSLFTDYAHKKRFVWMPAGTKATYNTDGTVLELPVGAALIKTFYYENVQNISPAGGTRIIETRVMIRKSTGWIFSDYVWNDDQTEATFSLAGSFTEISWKDEHGVIKSANYRIPSEAQCIVCHKDQKVIDGVLTTKHIPIGIKPQNMNFNYAYDSGSENQLTKWAEVGYLQNNFTLPAPDKTTVDYNDTSKSLELRARSYVDINCAHCHQTDRHCDYRPMRFAFSETRNNLANMGVCVPTSDMQDFPAALSKVVSPGNINRSMMYYRLNTTDEVYRMPLHGRTIIHDEGIQLIKDWINSLEPCQ